MFSYLCLKMILSISAVILAHILTSPSLNLWAPSSRMSLVKYFTLLNFFSSIWLLQFSVINGLSVIRLSGCGTEIPCCCCCFINLFSLISLQYFEYCDCVTFAFQSYDILPRLHIELSWYIGRTACYQALPLVTFHMNSWRRFPSTRYCFLLWLMRKRLYLVANSWCHMSVPFSLPSFNLFQSFTVDGWNVYWMQQNKGWIILF